MIDSVTFEKSTWGPLPLKFEPGTPMIAEAIAFGAAVDYLSSIGRAQINRWETELYSYLSQGLAQIEPLRRVGTATPRCPLQSFVIEGVHPLDLATVLDQKGIAVRSGNLCCRPLLASLQISALTRASLCFYNSKEDIDRCITALKEAITLLR